MTQKKNLVVLMPKSLAFPPGFEGVADLVNLTVTQSEEEALSRLGEADAYFQWAFASSILSAAPSLDRLKWVHAASLGVDTILVDPVLSRDITVTNTQGVYEYPIAEYVLALILYWLKDFQTTLHLKSTKTWQWRPTHGLTGKKVAIIGPGAIGKEIYGVLRAMRMEPILVGRTRRPATDGTGAVHSVDELPDLLPMMDGVVLSLPLTDDTEKFMDASRFSAMKSGAFFINIGRGRLVDEVALLQALAAGQVGFAGLDVFATEPLPATSPFWNAENVFVSPHMSADVYGWREQISAGFVSNLNRWLRNEPLQNVVDRGRLARRGS